MAAKDPRLYLIHIREGCERILDYTAGLGAQWADTPLLVDAVCRNLEIIGEAAAKLDPAFRQAHPEIPWRKIIDTRNILIHAYDQVNPVLLGGIVEGDVPGLLAAVTRLIDDPSH
jgi:uncharacterized protein with HEPN domain